jgi:peptide deformylase
MNLELVAADNPILLTPTVSFPFEKEDAEKVAEAMIKVMQDKRGLGLAANQIGLPWSMFVLDPIPRVIFNPEIIAHDGDELLQLEGCLTYPGLYVKIKRYQHVTVRFQDRTGAFQEQTFSDISARIVQHEMGHLDGKIFYNKASRFHRDAALKKWNRS